MHPVTVSEFTECLSRYSGPSSEHFSTLCNIDLRLGIDSKFPAAKNIVEKLLSLLQPKSDELSLDLAKWLQSLKYIQEERGKTKKWPLVAQTGRDGNPLGGKFKQYPIAALLLQNPNLDHTKQAESLLLNFLFSISGSSSRDLRGAANIFRRNIRPASTNLHLMSNLPIFDTYEQYQQDLLAFITSKKIENLSDKEKEFINTLSRILKPAPIQTNISTALGSPQSNQPPNNRPHSHHPILLDDYPMDASLNLLSLDTNKIEEGDSPSDLHIVESKQAEEQTTLNEAEVESHLLQTSFWLKRHERVVPFDTSRLTPVEKAHITNSLELELKSDVQNIQTAAVLLMIMYFTGNYLKDILSFSVGHKSTITRDGFYRRKLPTPRSSFKPTEVVKDDIHPLLSTLNLPLPTPLRNWLRTNISQEGMTLGENFEVDHEKAKVQVKALLKTMRKGGQFYRVKMDKFPTALALEMSVETHDPAAVYLLCARENQAAPTLAYYAVYNRESLTHLYQNACRNLMGQQ